MSQRTEVQGDEEYDRVEEMVERILVAGKDFR